MSSILKNFILLAFIFSCSSLIAASSSDIKKAEAVSDQWRATYKFSKPLYDKMHKNLDVVIHSHILMHQKDLDKGLQEKIVQAQTSALQEIVNDETALLPYILREYANNVVENERDHSKLDLEVRKIVLKSVKARRDALEAALKSIGLTAIRPLTQLHSMAVAKGSSLISVRTEKLLDSIVKKVENEGQKNRPANRSAESGKAREMDFSQ